MFALYKAGFSHIVDGVQCEIGRFEEKDLEDARENGWADHVEMLKSPKETQKKPRKVKHEDESTDN